MRDVPWEYDCDDSEFVPHDFEREECSRCGYRQFAGSACQQPSCDRYLVKGAMES